MEAWEQLSMETVLKQTEVPLQSCPQASRNLANPIHLQEKVKAMVTSVICGTKLQDASEILSRAGSSVKIRPVCLPELISGTSNEYLPTLPRWGIACHGEYGALVMSARRTDAKECLLSVETFPTPLSSDSVRIRYSEATLRKVGEKRLTKQYTLAGCNLTEYVAVYPTPQASSWGSKGSRDILQRRVEDGTITQEERKKMISGNGGKLNPTWVEWLMGFPIGWSDLGASETR